MIVVDSNVIFHAIMPSEFSADVRHVQKYDFEWNAPQLWISELRSTILKYVRVGHVSVSQANSLMILARRVMLGGSGTVGDDHVLRLASTSGCSPYDCEFVAMAEALNCPLITYDKQVLKAFSHIAITPHDFMESRR